MSKIYKEFQNFIKNNGLIQDGDSILAAVSGGADSMCMLSLLSDYCVDNNIRLGVVHINHGFRAEAVEEAHYVKDYCDQNSIPFYLKEIEPGSCRNSEEVARNLRYQLIREVTQEQGFSKIALAHNAQDRAETMLFNMFRGTGLTGLIGIRAQREDYIRPILFMRREEIEEYLKGRGIHFCTDSSNLEDKYSRNKIRHHIIPVAKEINPESISHLSKISDRLIQIERYIGIQCDKAYSEAIIEDESSVIINIDCYIKYEQVIRTEIIRRAIMGMTPHLKDITSDHVANIDEMAFKKENSRISLPYNITIIKEYNKLVILQDETNNHLQEYEITRDELTFNTPVREYTVGENKKLQFRLLNASELHGKLGDFIPRNKYTKWFDYDKINASLRVRSKAEADRIIIDNEGHTKSIGRLMIDSKIPARIRNQIPVVASGDEVLWLVGYRDSAGYRVEEKSKTILEIRLLEEKENG